MTKVNIVNNISKTQKPTHKVGNFYREEASGEVYILVTTDGTDMLLSCLNDGFRWGKATKVYSIYEITQSEFDASSEYEGDFTKIDSVTITIE